MPICDDNRMKYDEMIAETLAEYHHPIPSGIGLNRMKYDPEICGDI